MPFQNSLRSFMKTTLSVLIFIVTVSIMYSIEKQDIFWWKKCDAIAIVKVTSNKNSMYFESEVIRNVKNYNIPQKLYLWDYQLYDHDCSEIGKSFSSGLSIQVSADSDTIRSDNFFADNIEIDSLINLSYQPAKRYFTNINIGDTLIAVMSKQEKGCRLISFGTTEFLTQHESGDIDIEINIKNNVNHYYIFMNASFIVKGEKAYMFSNPDHKYSSLLNVYNKEYILKDILNLVENSIEK